MTIASAFVPPQPDAISPETRPQEPSMEDILASIRRIIADDQTQGSRSGFGSPQRAAPAPETAPEADDPEAVVAEGDLGLRSSNSQDNALDLAGIPSSFARSLPPDDHDVGLASNGAEMAMSQEQEEGDRAGFAEQSYSALVEETPPPPEEPVVYRARPDSPSRFRARTQSQRPARSVAAPPGLPASAPDPIADVPPMEDAAESDEPLMSPVLGASVMSAFETLAATVVLQNTEMLDRVMRELLRPLVKTWLDENLPTLVERLVRHEIERVARGGRG